MEKLRGKSLFTSNHILGETWTLVVRRAGYDFAGQRALNPHASQRLEILYSSEKDEIAALQLFKKFIHAGFELLR